MTLLQPYVSPTSALFQPYLSYTSALLQLYFSYTSALLQPYFSPTSALRHPYFSPTSALLQPYFSPTSDSDRGDAMEDEGRRECEIMPSYVALFAQLPPRLRSPPHHYTKHSVCRGCQPCPVTMAAVVQNEVVVRDRVRKAPIHSFHLHL